MSDYISLKEQVYNYISDKINDGTIISNEKINEKMIMEDLNISRTPVREALIQLSSEGYLENRPRKGFSVKHIDQTRVIETYKILGVLEGYAATQSVENLTSMDYRDMEMLIYGMDSAINDYAFTEYYVLQQRFHNIFITGSGNKELMITIAHLKKNFIRQTYNPIDQEKFKPILVEVNNGHKKILELLKSKDLSGLEAYLRNQHWGPHNASYETI